MTQRATTKQIPARRPGRMAPKKPQAPTMRAHDAQFEALLRTACLKTAGVGALSSLAIAVPGAGTLLRFALGELADLAMVGAIQERLIRDIFALYDLQLPAAVEGPLVSQVATFGAGASASVDALGRRLLGRYGGVLGGSVVGRVLPVATVLTSALGHVAMTYAVGKRAQALAKLRSAPAESLADAFRAFTGVDERRVWEWSLDATKQTIARFGSALRRVVPKNPFRRAEPEPAAPAVKKKVPRTVSKASRGLPAARRAGRGR